MKNKNLTVVVINDFDFIQGGATKVAIDTAQILYDNNVDVIYFSAVHKENNFKFKQITTDQKECLKDGIKGAFRGLYNFKVAKCLKKLLKKLDKENTIVHIHGWTKALSSSIFKVLGKGNFKVVLTLHDYFTVCPNGGFFNYKKCEICKKKAMSLGCVKSNCDSRNYIFKLYRVLRQYIQNRNVKKCKNLNLINISDFSLDKLKNYFDKNINIKKIYNPIKIEKQDRTNVENNDYYIYVGRVSKEKGVDKFCEAIKNLNLNAIVVGDGDQKDILEKKYKDSNIKFVGWQNTDSVCSYIKKSKALIFTSVLYETMGLTILEAKALGVPCIVSNLTAGSEFIDNTKDGLLYDGTVEDLKSKILLYEKSDIKNMSNIAYQNYWKSKHDDNHYYENLINYYNEIIK